MVNMMGQNHFFENHAGKFSDQTKRYFPRTPWGAMGVKFFDYDNDGRQDLFVTDMHSDMWASASPAEEKKKAPNPPGEDFLGVPASNFVFGNALYHDAGPDKFEEVSDRMGVENYWPWGPSVGDLNADGWDDIFIASSMNFPFRYGINSLLLNNRGQKFLDAEFLLGIEPRRGGRTHTPWFYLDCATVPASAKNGQNPCKGQTGMITVMAPLGSRSSAIFDLDNDGDLDIVVNNLDGPPSLLRNNGGNRNSWLMVKCIGTRSNRSAIGARVRVVAGGRAQIDEVMSGSGYYSQNDLRLHFGLGAAATVDLLEIAWPSGAKESFRDLEARQLVVIRESQGIVRRDRFERR
jgi:hypothetical protein